MPNWKWRIQSSQLQPMGPLCLYTDRSIYQVPYQHKRIAMYVKRLHSGFINICVCCHDTKYIYGPDMNKYSYTVNDFPHCLTVRLLEEPKSIFLRSDLVSIDWVRNPRYQPKITALQHKAVRKWPRFCPSNPEMQKHSRRPAALAYIFKKFLDIIPVSAEFSCKGFYSHANSWNHSAHKFQIKMLPFGIF